MKKKPKKNFILKFMLFLLIAIILFFKFFNFNYLKPRIENDLTQALDQSVKINGNIKMGLAGWRPAIALYKIKIGQKIAAEKFEISPDIVRPKDNSIWHFFVEIEGLRINNIELGDYYAPINLYSSGFDIPKLRGKLDGARLKGGFKFIDSKITVKAGLKNFPYSKIVEGMKGEAKLNINLKAKGKDITSITSTLNGKVTLIGGSGKIKNSALKMWTTDFFKAMFSGKKDFIEISCIVTDFNIKNGMATGKSIFLDTKDMTIVGKGGVNLISQDLNFKLTPKLKKTSLINIALPVRITGKINDPKVKPEATAIAKTLGTILLSAVNPAVMLIPLVTGGTSNKTPCETYLK